jgi:hypothetical protein
MQTPQYNLNSHQGRNYSTENHSHFENGYYSHHANSMSPKKIAYKNYQPTEDDIRILQDYVYKYAPPEGSPQKSPSKSPTRTGEIPRPDPELLAYQIEQMKSMPPEESESGSPVREGSKSPIKKHRGFGASAKVFNADDTIDVGGILF